MKIYDEMSKPFPEDRIHWRIGSTNKKKMIRETGNQSAKATKGIPLAYIDARDVMERLDFVVGPDNWEDIYPFQGCCELKIRIYSPDEPPRWVVKSNGAGVTDVEAEKGQYSDAFKRAAVLWGIGRYLYDLPNTWVDLDDWGKPKQPPKLPDWATPAGWNRIPLSQRQDFHKQMLECLAANDEAGVKELVAEWTEVEDKLQLWALFDSTQRAAIKVFQK